MAFKSLDDIERNKSNSDREEFKERVIKDTTEVFSKIRATKKKRNPIYKVLKFLNWVILGIGLLILCTNFLLANIWLFRWLIKSLFMNG